LDGLGMGRRRGGNLVVALTLPKGHEPRYDNFGIEGLIDETLREGSERCLFAVDEKRRYGLAEKIVDAGVRQLMVGSGPDDPGLLARCLETKIERGGFPKETQFVFVVLLNSWEPILESFKELPREWLADAVVSMGMIEIGTRERLLERVVEEFAKVGVRKFRASLLNNFSAGVDEERYASITAQVERCVALGMDTVRVNDSLGLIYPEAMGVLAANLVHDYPEVHFALHAHDDRGLGLQNALASVYNGFDHIEGAVAGFGNRSGLPSPETIELVFREKRIAIGDTTLDPQKLIEAAALAEDVFMTVPNIYRPVSGMLVGKENFGTLNIPDYLGFERETDYFLNQVGLHAITVRNTLRGAGFDEFLVEDRRFIEMVRAAVKDRMHQIHDLKRTEWPVLLRHAKAFYDSGVLTAADISAAAERCAEEYVPAAS